MPDAEAIAESMIAAMQDYIGKALAPVLARCAELEVLVKALPAPEKGDRGEPGPPGIGEKGDRGEPGIAGKDADPIHPDTVRLLVAEEVTKAVAVLPKARDGEPGRDAAQIEILPALDEAKVYARGVFGTHRGAFVRASRTTDPLAGKSLETAGWQIIVDGDRDVDILQAEDLRTFTFRKVKASGLVVERKVTLPVIIDRGVFHAGDEYAQGDACTWDGSLWIAQKTTGEKPGTNSDWRLAVKRGRDGKDLLRAA